MLLKENEMNAAKQGWERKVSELLAEVLYYMTLWLLFADNLYVYCASCFHRVSVMTVMYPQVSYFQTLDFSAVLH